MKAPEGFTSKLKKEFPDLHLRWSSKQGCWMVEQQVGRGALPPFRFDSDTDDRYVRAKLGRWLVCQVSPGDRIPCPECHLELPVPHLKFAEVTCGNCLRKGKDGRVTAGYFPLSNALLDHLRRTDPRRDAIRRLAAEADAANEKMLEEKSRQVRNDVQAITLEDFNKMFGIQSVGFTGKEKAWKR